MITQVPTLQMICSNCGLVQRIFLNPLPKLQFVEFLLHAYDAWGLRLSWHQLTDILIFAVMAVEFIQKKCFGVLETSTCLRSCAIVLNSVEFQGSRELPHLEIQQSSPGWLSFFGSIKQIS